VTGSDGRCSGENLETNIIELRDPKKLKVWSIAELRGTRYQLAIRVGIYSCRTGASLGAIAQLIAPRWLVIAARGNGIERHVDARERRRFDKNSAQIIGVWNECSFV
jgi:hypothetical protein